MLALNLVAINPFASQPIQLIHQESYRGKSAMSNNEQQIEQEIQAKGLNAPRLTPEHIDSKVKAIRYLTGDVEPAYAHQDYMQDKSAACLTICILTLENGFTVTGESACASPENFDAYIGQKIAYENAREKIWLLEGYLLKQRLYKKAK